MVALALVASFTQAAPVAVPATTPHVVFDKRDMPHSLAMSLVKRNDGDITYTGSTERILDLTQEKRGEEDMLTTPRHHYWPACKKGAKKCHEEDSLPKKRDVVGLDEGHHQCDQSREHCHHGQEKKRDYSTNKSVDAHTNLLGPRPWAKYAELEKRVKGAEDLHRIPDWNGIVTPFKRSTRVPKDEKAHLQPWHGLGTSRSSLEDDAA
jgi:hypothetical protein